MMPKYVSGNLRAEHVVGESYLIIDFCSDFTLREDEI